jgi:hypothetical protein
VCEKCQLLEWGYRDLWGEIDWDFIHMRDHYKAIQDMGVHYLGLVDGMPDMLHFKAPSESRPGLQHDVYVQLVDLEKELQNPENNNIGDAVRQAMSGDVLVHCDCEAFLYYYQWLLLSMGAAIMPTAQGNPPTKYDGGDVRAHPPNKKNPKRKGTVCKHLGNVLKVLPFWWTDIAGELQQAGYDVAPSTVEVPAEPQQPAVAPQVRQPQPGGPVVAPSRPTPVSRRGMMFPTFPMSPEQQAQDLEPGEILVPGIEPEQPRQQRTPKKKKAKKARRPRQRGESFESMVNELLGMTG